MRNNLFEILTTKINILGNKKLACCEWELTKSILAQAKSEKTFKLVKNNNKQQLTRTQKTEHLYLFLSIF